MLFYDVYLTNSTRLSLTGLRLLAPPTSTQTRDKSTVSSALVAAAAVVCVHNLCKYFWPHVACVTSTHNANCHIILAHLLTALANWPAFELHLTNYFKCEALTQQHLVLAEIQFNNLKCASKCLLALLLHLNVMLSCRRQKERLHVQLCVYAMCKTKQSLCLPIECN